MSYLNWLIPYLLVWLFIFRTAFSFLSVQEYFAARDKLQIKESMRSLGASLILTGKEELVNNMLMVAKKREFKQSSDNLNFAPAIHFFNAKPLMLESQVFQFIRQMPKGGVLHIHSSSLTPLEFLIYNATYRPDLYVCSPTKGPALFKFSSSIADLSPLPDCQWNSVGDRRAREGEQHFDAWLRNQFSFYTPNPHESFPNINSVWTAFENTLISVDGIISYGPVFTDYLYQGLGAFHEDNVQYIEIRTTLFQVYYLNGTLLDKIQVTQLYKETFDRFRNDHPDFSGAKIIFSPVRRINNQTLSKHLELAIQLTAKFPDIVAGFDLVGQEDLGPPLKDFTSQLLTARAADSKLKYFFHAGETNWLGTEADENLIDAVLLNSTRIGHGFAITKHPEIMEMARRNGIAIEICPISNQVLGLTNDLRNHPAGILFTNGFPLVVSSDGPASWDAVGLSSDFYMAFMGLAGKRADLRTLKQLAINSIIFSAMTVEEKRVTMSEWQRRWDKFIFEKFHDLEINQIGDLTSISQTNDNVCKSDIKDESLSSTCKTDEEPG